MADLVPHDYQLATAARVEEHWAAGVKRVVAVMVTGSGKTVTACIPVAKTVNAGGRVLWLAHRRELIAQAARSLVACGIRDVGMISPQHHPDRWAKVQVASSDTLVSRGHRPEADLVVFDEVHHAVAKTYRSLLESYPEARVLGLTATPARGDGKALGEVFEQLVVGATYSQMLALNKSHPDQGIVPCRVFQPPRYLGSDLAQEPLDGWRGLQKLGLDGSCFAFARDVEDAKQRVREFRMAGITSDYISGKCSNDRRQHVLYEFRAGRVMVLWNYGIFTEGTDVPDVRVIMLERGCSNPGAYLQIAGRGLRPAPGKDCAVLLDLVGVSRKEIYGAPTIDRTYSLDGSPITVDGVPLKNCPKCGSTIPAALPICDSTMPDGSPCRYVFEGKPRKAPKVWNLELQEAVDAAGGDIRAVPMEAKVQEALTLLKLARTNGYDVLWAVQRWKKTFSEAAFPLRLLSPDERGAIYAKFVAQGKAGGWKPIAARVKYKALMGAWPDQS